MRHPRRRHDRTAASPLPAAVLLLIAFAAPLFAGGDKEDKYPFVPVEGESHWSYRIDLEDKDEGKHNLVIRAVDAAGNVRFEGPYDFRIDPETDLPVVSVSHPQPGGRVGRVLPVIGTSRDDDGVSRVEVKVDDGSWQRAQGEGAWSILLDAESYGDGPHTLFVRTVDINNLEGETISVPFIVDTTVPSGGIDDPPGGTLISGKTKFTGVIEDPNGVTALAYSQDGRETWENVKFRKDKAAGTATFDISFDSRDYEDGPVVWWIRGTDSLGSSSEAPFLFFVDNVGPVLELVYPAAPEGEDLPPVPGDAMIIGTVRDASAVAKMTIGAGKQDDIVEIPLIPGNPWWSYELDLSGRKDKFVTVEIVAEDGAGNTSQEEIRIPLDPEADKPILTVAEVPQEAYGPGDAYLSGTFFDDDGAGAVIWKAGDLEGRLAVERSWKLDLSDLPAGTSELRVRGEDRFGLAGDEIRIPVTIAPEPPWAVLESFGGTDGVAWSQGLVIPFAGGELAGAVTTTAPSKGVTVTLTLDAEEPRNLALRTDPEDPSRRLFKFSVKRGLTAGRHDLILTATDGFGGEYLFGGAFYVEGPATDDGSVADPRDGDRGVHLLTPFLRSDGAVILDPDHPLEGWVVGGQASGARFDPPTDLLTLTPRGENFVITAAREGITEPVRVVLSDGTASDSFIFLTDLRSPRVSVTGPLAGSWSSGNIEASGTVEETGGLATLQWRIDGGSPTSIPFEESSTGRYTFTDEWEITGRPDGPVDITVEAIDESGQTTKILIPIDLDTAPPALDPVSPPAGQPVGARSLLTFRLVDDGLVSETAITVDGENWSPGSAGKIAALSLDLGGYPALPETLAVRAIDRAGNVLSTTPDVPFDPASDKPVTMIQTPPDGSTVRGLSDIAGLVADDDAVEKVFWRIDGGSWKELDGGASFRTPLPLETLQDGSHVVEVYAVDVAGNEGESDQVVFALSRRDAEVVIESPAVGISSRSVTAITGTAIDANGISEVWISFDNGNTYHRADGATNYDGPDAEVEAGNKGDAETDAGVPSAETEETDSEETETADEEAVIEETPVKDTPAEEAVDDTAGPIIYDDPVTWSYPMDTTLLDEGVHSLLVKVIDGAGDDALIAGLLEVDNEAPLLVLGSPEEGGTVSGVLSLEGRVRDTGGLENFNAKLLRGDEAILEQPMAVEGVFLVDLPLGSIEPGEAILKIEAIDRAGNTTSVSRSLTIAEGRANVTPVISLPAQGAEIAPFFVLSGYVDGYVFGDTAELLIDGVPSGNLDLDPRGRFSREFVPGDLEPGVREFRVDVRRSDSELSTGTERTFTYRGEGGWVILDGFPPGSSVGSRPLISGRAGYWLPPPPEDSEKDIESAYVKALKAGRPQQVEISLDGGRTFEKVKGKEEWSFRIETGEMSEGDLPIVVRVLYPEGWAYERTLVKLDKSIPDLKLHETVEGGRYNGTLVVSGTAADDQELQEVSVSVRPGGKGRYRVPAFIQGLYLDVSALGATWFDVGIGISFFDDNVKLQVQVGLAPDTVYDPATGEYVSARISGVAVGATLLANIVFVPLEYWFGPNWDKLSWSIALGANFTYFSDFGDGTGGVLSSIVAQMEIPKIEFPDRRFITYVAPYIEGQLWFFSSDVAAGVRFLPSFGVRLGLL